MTDDSTLGVILQGGTQTNEILASEGDYEFDPLGYTYSAPCLALVRTIFARSR